MVSKFKKQYRRKGGKAGRQNRRKSVTLQVTLPAKGKRKSAGVAPPAKRRKFAGGSTAKQGGEFARLKPKVVGKANKVLTLKKLSKLSTAVRYFRWQKINPMNRTSGTTIPGAINLNHSIGGGGVDTEVPCHVYCLNSTRNNATEISVGFKLVFNDLGRPVFEAIPNVNRNGVAVTSGTWESEGSEGPAVGLGQTYIHNDYADIKMLAYGAKTQSTEYIIDIIRFKYDYLDPYEGPVEDNEVDDRSAVWQGMVRQLIFNPIFEAPQQHGKGKYDVLYSTKFSIAPSLENELDTTPSSRAVKIFYPIGKIFNYKYTAKHVTTDAALEGGTWVRDGSAQADYNNIPAAPARLWLRVRAMNTTLTTPDNTNTPSYDMLIRKKERLNV